MSLYSTTEVARRLGIGLKTLARYIEQKKIPPPEFVKAGKITIHAWTEAEIEHVRQLLPKIANGRKTRYMKKTKAQPKSTVPRKKRSSKKPKPPSG